MWEGNHTEVKFFILRGISIGGGAQAVLFPLFLLVYTLALVENLTIILLVRSNTSLHTPMYILLGNLSFAEIWYTTATVPKMLSGFLSEKNYISFIGCFLQYFFFFSLGSTEGFILTIMGYDRYLAICHPLRYNLLMSGRICYRLATICWVTGFLWTFVPVILVSRLPFCGNEIDHLLCDTGPLLELSCVRDFLTEVTSSVVTSVLILISLSFTCISYLFIIKATIRIPSLSGRLRAFSTCASHLTVVLMFIGGAMYMYVRPTGEHPLYTDKAVALIYTAVTPFLNPVIYSLRNKQFIEAVKKIMQHLLYRLYGARYSSRTSLAI
ncbi:olfactory receptor 11H6-like [Rhinatrema bivittatum]|uniref:olfactory receptor 11H6-like n=1 Tax=Rhinatrema bivittatum TaxID=194408 RepID=UPI00112C375F|nr:olfactory receptor 11H6-like [Rhinatrema bivittatum]